MLSLILFKYFKVHSHKGRMYIVKDRYMRIFCFTIAARRSHFSFPDLRKFSLGIMEIISEVLNTH